MCLEFTRYVPKVYTLDVEPAKLWSLSNETRESETAGPLFHEVGKSVLLVIP